MLDMTNDNKVITIRADVKEQLNEIGRRDDTFSALIERLIASYKQQQQKAQQ
jgi:predicted CopG family antitoxin